MHTLDADSFDARLLNCFADQHTCKHHLCRFHVSWYVPCPQIHLQDLFAESCMPKSNECVHAHAEFMHSSVVSVCRNLMKAPMPMHTLCPCIHPQDLYAKICGVSYIGDVRMGFAEDSRKIERIATGSAEGLALMYNKRLQVETCSCLHTTHPVTLPCTTQQVSCVWLHTF